MESFDSARRKLLYLLLIIRRKLRGAAPYVTGQLGISCSFARGCGRIAMRDGNEDVDTEKGLRLFRLLLSLKLNVIVANGRSLSPPAFANII